MVVATAPVARQAATEMIADALAALEGRRFEVADMTPALTAAATVCADTYSGTFSFMLEMRDAARRRGLTVGQAKGVCNCVRADLQRAPAAAAPLADVLGPAPLEVGIYVVQLDGEAARVRIKPLTPDQCARYGVPANTVKVGFYSHGDTDTSYLWTGLVSDNRFVRRWKLWLDEVPESRVPRLRALYARVEPALRVLASDPAVQRAAGVAYAEEAGCCFKCGKTLLDDLSRARSVGPECWKKYGLGA